jgi:hypothetical protein
MHDDDVWGSDSEGEHGRHVSSELDQEWQARQSQFHTLGYRDGVEAGKNSSVQEGFNLGYAEAAVAGFNWGVARGLASAFAALPASVKETLICEGGARGRLEALEASIRSYSSTDALRSFYRDLSKNLEAGSDAVQAGRSVQGLAALAEEPLRSGVEPGVVSMAGLNRLPESYSAGVWEADHRDETEQGTVPVGSLVVSKEPGNHEDEESSSFISSAAGKSELEELEKKVRNELEVASIKISDILVGV